MTAKLPIIVFDLDGTLVDTAPSLCTAGNHLLKTINRSPVDVETYKRFIGKGILKQVEQLLIHTGGIPENNLEKYFILFRSYYDTNLLMSTNLYSGVFNTLNYLRDFPARLALCTQKAERPAREILSGLNILKFFEGFAFGDSLPLLKPDPEMVFFATRKFDSGPLIYIGDSEIDAVTAQNAKAFFLIYTGGYRHVSLDQINFDAAFDRHEEIPELIRKILSDVYK